MLAQQNGRTWMVLGIIAMLAMNSQANALEKAKKKDPAPPEILNLMTKDSVSLHAVYYPGDRGKSTVPVILIHGWEGSRGAGRGLDCHELAVRLQRDGHAVIVPDLRGHGRSTIRRRPNGIDEKIERDRLNKKDFREMPFDIEAVKKFLMKENNAGKLNIELLCVVGFDMGAVVGLNWINYDWSVPSLPTLKQGQDVKAFVLVSPSISHRGATLLQALQNENVRSDLSAMIVFGDQTNRVAADGRRIYRSLKRHHPKVPADRKQAERVQDLFLIDLDTSLQGTKLLSSPTLKVQELIAAFVKARLVDRAERFPWQDRTPPS